MNAVARRHPIAHLFGAFVGVGIGTVGRGLVALGGRLLR